MNELANKIVELVASDNMLASDRDKLVTLIGELLGHRKEWFECLKNNIALPQEIARGILS
ncbi:hypothetical protein A7985_07410 [Pseudoalteromonas luteoviolacea]|uniref:Uncharacterized protein n=1 Tax=Pseudoalteromonas luteoviolacea TaxID=43657 RepID=A0A1C0TWS3_9GAMM|nr:hypothetical protein A7985_07410 [Pseudoalteromonas luteoviolacea]